MPDTRTHRQPALRLAALTLAAASALAAPAAQAYSLKIHLVASEFFGTQRILDIGPQDGLGSFDDTVFATDASGTRTVRSSLRVVGPEAHGRLQIDGALGLGSAQATFADALRVVSPNGDPVRVRFSLPTEGSIVSLHSVVDVSARLGLCGGPCDVVTYTRHANNGVVSGTDPVPVVLPFHDGDVLQLAYRFTLDASTGGFGQAYTVDADYLNTSLARLEVLTPGATLAGGSGLWQITTTPVPEPGRAALLLAGAGLLLAAGQRRRPR